MADICKLEKVTYDVVTKSVETLEVPAIWFDDQTVRAKLVSHVLAVDSLNLLGLQDDLHSSEKDRVLRAHGILQNAHTAVQQIVDTLTFFGASLMPLDNFEAVIDIPRRR